MKLPNHALIDYINPCNALFSLHTICSMFESNFMGHLDISPPVDHHIRNGLFTSNYYIFHFLLVANDQRIQPIFIFALEAKVLR